MLDFFLQPDIVFKAIKIKRIIPGILKWLVLSEIISTLSQ